MTGSTFWRTAHAFVERERGDVEIYACLGDDCHDHDTFDEYHTGLRQLLLEVVAKVRIKEEYKVMNYDEDEYDMCKAFVDMKLEGIEEGRAEGQRHLINVICKKLQKGKSVEVIADELEEELPDIERVIAAQQQAGSYDVEEIYKVYCVTNKR